MSLSDSEDEDQEPSVRLVYVVKSYSSRQRQILRVNKEPLGSGTQANVYPGTTYSLSIFNFAKNVAVKLYHRPKTFKVNLEHEISMLQQFQDHENIVRFLGESYSRSVLIGFVMEKLLFTLNQLVQNYSAFLHVPFQYKSVESGVEQMQQKLISVNSILLFVFTPVMEALKHLHSRNILFRDIKPENIMLGLNSKDKPVLKLVDFGGAIEEENITKYLFYGTLNYKPPECYNKYREYTKLSEAMTLGMNICYIFDILFPYEPRFHNIYEPTGFYEMLEDQIKEYYETGVDKSYFLNRLACKPEEIKKKLAQASREDLTSFKLGRSSRQLKTPTNHKKRMEEVSSERSEERGRETEVYKRFIDCFIHLDPEKRVKIEDVLEENWIKEDWRDTECEEFRFMEQVTYEIIGKHMNSKKSSSTVKWKQFFVPQKPSQKKKIYKAGVVY